MSTVGEILEETRGHLLGFHKAKLNRLNGAVDLDDGVLNLEFSPDFVGNGSIVALDDELCFVWETQGSLLTVQRAYLGSQAANHPKGTLVDCNPRFPTFAIRTAMAREIASWVPRLYARDTLDLQIGTAQRAYELAVDGEAFLHIVNVEQRPSAVADGPINVGYRTLKDYGAFASGIGILLENTPAVSSRLAIVYARDFDLSVFDDDTDLVTDIGIPHSALDIVSLGAAWRLLTTREIGRTAIDSAPEPRVAQDVPAGHILQAARELKNQRDARIGEEGRLIMSRHGIGRP